MKKVIIVGASSGIGYKLAQIYANNGFLVGITGRRIELLNELKNENPNSFFVKQFDVMHTESINQKLDELASEIGGLDLLILSSGTGELNLNLDFEIDQPTLKTNVLGFTCIADWTFNYFEKQKYGHLVGITSVAGIRGGRVTPAYNASKAYQINYLEGLSQKAHKIKLPIFISDIRAGFVDTAMAKGKHKFWVSSVKKASNQIYEAIKHKKEIVYITKRWELIGCILKFIPRFIFKKF